MSAAVPAPVAVPFREDALARLAERIVAQARADLPDLSRVTVLLPEPSQAGRLRAALLERVAGGALLGPHIATLRAWGLARADLERAPPDPHRSLLMLYEALREHPGPFARQGHWTLARELLALFEELTLQQASVEPDARAFAERLRAAYGLARPAAGTLDLEARLVHDLWGAWHRQHAQEDLPERTSAYLQGLARGLATLGPDERVLVAVVEPPTRAEAAWLHELLACGRGELLVHGPVAGMPGEPGAPLEAGTAGAHAAPPRSRFLDALLEADAPALPERAAACREALPESPLAGDLRLCRAAGLEHEARIADVQIRRWLAQGRRRIGVVTEDRALARRLRALLERSGVTLRDGAGWALSTTSAATVIERWLECVEDDFAHRPLLDVLKSPFLHPEPDHPRLRAVYRLEQDVIRHEGIARGLDRYRAALRRRADRLGPGRGQSGAVEALLDRLARAGEPLLALTDGQPHAAPAFIRGLQEGLDRLGVTEALAGDEAGERVLALLERLLAAASADAPLMRWEELRSWLGDALEHDYFRPATDPGPVQLLDAARSRLCRFDALVIAGVDARHWPGEPSGGALFNDRVRAALGLTTGAQRRAQRVQDLRRLLESAPLLLLTVSAAQGGEPVAPSPWLELLETFHRLAYGTGLRDETLERVAEDPRSLPFESDRREHPPVPPPPAPAIDPVLLPGRLSVTAHQRLVSCPYQFYARYCLGLAAPEAVAEALSKADYGQLVHRCLEAFHADVPGLPGPFRGPLEPARRAEAEAVLEAISAAVFAAALEDSFEHRGWLERWRALIPAYVGWAVERAAAARIEATERPVEAELSRGLVLEGRLDRYDRDDEGLRIVDYKTGAVPRRREVERGDDVQIASYALLEPEAHEVAYLQLDRGRVAPAATVAGEALIALRDGVAARLAGTYAALREGRGAPANGDDGECRYCEAAGLCRRAVWAPVR